MKKNYFILILVGGICLRLLLLFLDFSFDVNSYIVWAKEAVKFSLPGFYERAQLERYGTVYPNYPPLSIFFFIIFYQLYQLIFLVAWKINLILPVFPSKIVSFLETRAVLAGFIKLPGVFFDIASALLLYQFAKKIIKKKTSCLPVLAAAAILFNPGFFYNSGYLGQIESVPLFFVLLSFYLLFFSKNIFWSLPLFALAILSKQTATVFFPVIIFVFIKKRGWKPLAKGAFISLGLFMLTFLPFYQRGNFLLFPFITYVKRILFAPGLPFASNHAFNFWALITGWKDVKDTAPFLFFNYQLWGFVISGILILVLSIKFFKKSLTLTSTLRIAGLIALTAFLFFTKIHERHLQQVLPFLLLAGLKDKKFLKAFYFFSFVYFINIYHNWPVPKIIFLENFIRLPVIVNGLIIVSLFIYLWLGSGQNRHSKPD